MAKSIPNLGGRLALQMTYLPNDKSKIAEVTHLILDIDDHHHGIFKAMEPNYKAATLNSFEAPELISTEYHLEIKGRVEHKGVPGEIVLRQHAEPVPKKPKHAKHIRSFTTGYPICDFPARKHAMAPMDLGSGEELCGDCKDVLSKQWGEML